MSEGISICGRPEEWGRGYFRCPFCLEKRRGLMAPVFGGYGSSGVCGGCGSRFHDGEGRFESDYLRSEEARQFVRATWPKARPWRVIFRECIESERASVVGEE